MGRASWWNSFDAQAARLFSQLQVAILASLYLADTTAAATAAAAAATTAAAAWRPIRLDAQGDDGGAGSNERRLFCISGPPFFPEMIEISEL